jgi:hypothetical protein
MPPLLASSDPTVTLPLTSPIFLVGSFMLAVPLLVATLNGLLQIIARFKQKPPIHDVYATKEELLQTEQRLSKQIEGDGHDLVKVEERLTATRTEMEERLSTQIEEVKDKQDRNHSSVQNELKSIAGQIGKIFGSLEAMGGKRGH